MKDQKTPLHKNRRQFLKNISLGVGSTIIGVPVLANSSPLTSNYLSINNSPKQSRKLGVALVGLGQYSAKQLAPALQETENCYLAGIVTGTPAKVDVWKEKYNIPDKNVYNYDNFDQIAENKDIDIVYVVLPISMHAEFTTRAAKAKKHVICEKPMALNAMEAQQMVDACKQNGVHLAIGYRLHFEPFNKRVMELGQQQVYGKVTSIEANNTSNMTNGNLDVWRLRRDLAGGGPLMDLGIYCVQGACYTLGENPVAVTANYGEINHPLYFYDVEESISWEMEFDNGVKAKCHTSYGAENGESLLSAKAAEGWWELNPAYGYEGKKGKTQEGNMNLPNIYEQVKQMDAQAMSFKNDEKSIVPGEMGVRDMKIITAIYESANKGGKRIALQL